MKYVIILLFHLELKRIISCSGLSRNFLRCGRIVQVRWLTEVDRLARSFARTPGGFSSALSLSETWVQRSSFFFKDSPSFRIPFSSQAPHSLRIFTRIAGCVPRAGCLRCGHLLTLDLQHIPSGSLDIYAILYCKHRCVSKSFTHD